VGNLKNKFGWLPPPGEGSRTGTPLILLGSPFAHDFLKKYASS
jgi:hypothetical protein